MSKKLVFVVGGGKIRTLHDDRMSLAEFGKVEVKRASHVEGSADLTPAAILWLCAYGTPEQHRQFSHWGDIPELQRSWLLQCIGTLTPDKIDPKKLAMLQAGLPTDVWWVDLLPSGGPVLGPFPNHARQQALDAEIAWINEHVFKVKPETSAEADLSPKV